MVEFEFNLVEQYIVQEMLSIIRGLEISVSVLQFIEYSEYNNLSCSYSDSLKNDQRDGNETPEFVFFYRKSLIKSSAYDTRSKYSLGVLIKSVFKGLPLTWLTTICSTFSIRANSFFFKLNLELEVRYFSWIPLKWYRAVYKQAILRWATI